jgi:fatty acid desaturase
LVLDTTVGGSVETAQFSPNANVVDFAMDKLFPQNEQMIERAVRLVIGLALISLVFVGPRTLWGLVGVVPLLTGAIGSCPLYTLFGFSTCSMKR